MQGSGPEVSIIQKTLNGRRRHRYDFTRPDYSETVCLRLSVDMRRRVGVELTPGEVFQLNQQLKDLAYERIFDSLDLCLMMVPGFQIKWGIYNLLGTMGMTPDEASYEAISKAYYRHRKKRQGDTAIKMTWSRITFNAASMSDSRATQQKKAA